MSRLVGNSLTVIELYLISIACFLIKDICIFESIIAHFNGSIIKISIYIDHKAHILNIGIGD